MHGVQAIAKAAPATIGPPLPARSSSASTCHSRFSRVMNSEPTKSTPIAMISAAETLVSVCLLSVEEGAEAGRGEAEDDEDRREAGDEEQAGAEHPPPAGVVELGGRDAGDRREVAGHERQDAGGEEGDDPRAECGEDGDPGGGVGADGSHDHDPSGYLRRAPAEGRMRRMELPPLPAGFAGTRESLHRLAEDVIKPAREQTSGEWTLTDTPGGFGTPVFGDDRQVRVEGAELVVRVGGDRATGADRVARRGGRADRAGPAARRASRELPAEPLEVDPEACAALAAGYALAREVLGPPGRRRPGRPMPRASRPSGPSTSTWRSSWGRRPPGGGPTTGSPRGTRTTPSRTSTSAPGRPSTTATSGTPTASPAPSSATVSWRRATTRSGSPSTSA